MDAGNQTRLGTDAGVFTPLPTPAAIGAAPTAHTHAIADVTGLQPALDGKAPTVHTHTAAQVTDFSEAVDDRVGALVKAGANMSVVYDDNANTLTLNATATPMKVSADAGNQSKLGTDAGIFTPLPTPAAIGAAPATHTHAIADVTGLQPALDGKAPTVHTHTAAQITDFAEAVDDRAAALIKAGANTTVTYDDVANTLTIGAVATAMKVSTDAGNQSTLGTDGGVYSLTRDIRVNDAIPGLHILQSGGSDGLLVTNQANDLSPFVITKDSVVVVGHTSSIPILLPSGTLSGVPGIQINGANTGRASLGVNGWFADTSGPTFAFAKSNGTSPGVHVAPAAGSNLGTVLFESSNGTAFVRSAGIAAYTEGVLGAANMPARLEFATSDGTVAAPQVRMTVDSAGTVNIPGIVVSGGDAPGVVLAGGTALAPTANVKNIISNRTGTLAAYTVTLPITGVKNGHEMRFITRNIITALTVDVEGGGLGYNLPVAASMAAGTSMVFVYSSTAAAWFRG
jgi:hypothetical protein